jgi:UDP-N-acetylglucosamine 2-epimerase
VLLGTRPEAIKLFPVVRALRQRGMAPDVLLTGQHAQLLERTLSELDLRPDANLQVMTHDQGLGALSARLLKELDRLLPRRGTRVAVVQGDTTTVAMGALAAFYHGIRVAHVEAGLRSGNPRNPFPEEMNRRLTACLTDVHFAPTPRAQATLLAEGVSPERVHLVGNTVVDALFLARDLLLPKAEPDPELAGLLAPGRRLVLVTAHRRESFGSDMVCLCKGIADVARRFSASIRVVFPVHLNPRVRAVVHPLLRDAPEVHLLEALSYLRFVRLLLHAALIITDSGGIQEEAAALGIPVLVVRRTTERPEAVEAGVGELVPPEQEAILTAASRLLEDPELYAQRARPTTAFGDGHAAERIADVLVGIA